MAAAARYWKVSIQVGVGNYWRSTALSECQWFDIAGVDLSSGLLEAAISITGNGDFRTGGAKTNLVDGLPTTEIWYAPYLSSGHVMSLSFDFGAPVLPEYVQIAVSSTKTDIWTAQPAAAPNTLNHVYVWSSDDGLNWGAQSFTVAPFSSYGVKYRVPATVSSKEYPIPSRTLLGGAAGIYGIVSEDGVAMPNRPVFLLERQSLARIGYTTTDEYGGYAFNGLNDLNEYMVLSTDPSGPPYKNAIVWDRVSPINTKGNLQPSSAFWARRARHPYIAGVVSCFNYLSGTTYNWIGPNVLGSENHYRNHSFQFGFDFAIVPDESTAGGALKFLKSNRTTDNVGYGMTIWDSEGVVSNTNIPAQPQNYSELTFEYIFKAPAIGESGLIIVHGGTRDSDDRRQYANDSWSGRSCHASGPTLEVSTSVINVRFPLGASNRALVRCSYDITPGLVYHVIVTYKEDDFIKLYVDGLLKSTATIAGGGRLYGRAIYSNADMENWDYNYNGTYSYPGYIRRLHLCQISGYGVSQGGWSSDLSTVGTGWGGAVALVAKYYSTFSDSEVGSFYDSYLNWGTHSVGTTQSGYMAEVEADSPTFYTRLNDLSKPPKLERVMGTCDYLGTYQDGVLYSRLGFVSGSTSVNFSNAALVLTGIRIATVFTVEFFCRQTSTAGTQYMVMMRRYNAGTHMYVYASEGALYLNLTDLTGQAITINLGFTMVLDTAYHVAVSYDPWTTLKCKLYINGALISEKPAPVIPDVYSDTWNGPFFNWLGLGCNVSRTAPTIDGRFQGDMGEFAVYQYEVPAERIAAHYAARNA